MNRIICSKNISFVLRVPTTKKARTELITKYGQAFKEKIFDEAVEKVDCELEGKVYAEKENKSGKDEKTDNSKAITK